MKPTYNGKRKGAGRPPGTLRGRNTVTRSLSMPPAMWAAIDAARGTTPRGKWIAEKIGLPTGGK